MEIPTGFKNMISTIYTALKADMCSIIPTSDEVSSEFNGGAEGSSQNNKEMWYLVCGI